MNWINKCKLPAVKAIKFNNQLCLEIDDLWNALHFTFNKAQDRHVDFSLLDELQDNKSEAWLPFSKVKFINVICNCNNSSIPKSNKLS